jgi:hypothetical protein
MSHVESCFMRCRALKAINLKQYLSTSLFLVDNRYFVIKSSHTTQLYIKKFEQTELLQRMEKIYQTSCMAYRFDCLIKLNLHIFNLSKYVAKNDYFFCPNNILVCR